MPIPFSKDIIDQLFVPTVRLNMTVFINACSELSSPTEIKGFIFSFDEDCFPKEYSREKIVALASDKWELIHSKNIEEVEYQYQIDKFVKGETHP